MVRFVTSKDTGQIIDLWTYCFNDRPEFVDFYFSNCYKPENTLAVFEDNKLCSCLQLRPYKILLRNIFYDVYYIVGVATWPEYRGRGYVRELIKQTDSVMKERNVYLSVLLPFQYDFYRKYGWEVCYDLLSYSDLKLCLPEDIQTGQYERINSTDDHTDLNKCYSKYMQQFNGYVVRSKSGWYQLIRDVELENGACYIYNEGGLTTGYLIFTIVDDIFVIRELAHIHPNAKKSLLKLAVSHMGQIKRIKWNAPGNDITYLFMKDSRNTILKQTYVMGRIHDVKNALAGLPMADGTINLKISDPVYEDNNRCLMLRGADGKAVVTCTSGIPDAELGIQTLNQLFWGYISVDSAANEGLIKFSRTSAPEKLAQLFPPQNNCIYEEF